MTASKTSLLTQIEETLARNSANVSVNLINIAQIFAKLDERLAGIEIKLEKLLAERPPLDARAEELLALIDARVKIALERNEREHLEAVAGVARDVLSEFMGESRQLRSIIEGKLTQPPFDPAARERPN